MRDNAAMAIPIALDKLRAALAVLATGDRPAATRLQAAWDGPVGELWEGIYLPTDLNEQFKQMWADYAAPSEDPRSTALRELTPSEEQAAIRAVVGLALAAAASDAVGATPGKK